MKYQIVMPFIYIPYMEECVSTIKLPSENILLVDNTQENIGVAASWNKGIEKMRERGCDWLIIISAAIRFGEKGMQDFIDQVAITDKDILACEPSHGWHCIAIRSSVFDRVGTFDENFYPIYFEDNDFGIRCGLEGSILWGSVEGIQIENKMWNHSGQLAKVKVDSEKLLAYLLRKWGGKRDYYEFKHPFNNPENSIKYWKKGDIEKN